MATNTIISTASRNAAADAIVDLIDVGSTNAAGKLRIYDGTQPAGPDTAITTQNLLAELDLSNPAFGNAASGVATASAITDDSSANATGTASWFRVVDRDLTAILDGEVGTSGADLNLDSVSIVTGNTVSVTSWTVTMPAS